MNKKFHSLLLFSTNLKSTAEFYKKLGFNVEKSEDTLKIIFGDFRIAIMDEKKATIKDDQKSKKGVGIFLYFEVDNVDSYYEEIVMKGIKASSKPKDWPWGKREFATKDPDSYKLVFFSKI